MKVTFKFEGTPEQIREDIKKIFGFISKNGNKEENISLQTVKKVTQEPVAPVQQKKLKTKQPESENIKTEITKETQEQEIKSLKCETTKDWTAEQKEDIKAIRDAYEKLKKGKEEHKESKKHRSRRDIDNSLIVYMKDEQNMTFTAIAKQIGCCPQTATNRYNIGKRDAQKPES